MLSKAAQGMAVAGFRQQAAESASRRRRLAANLVLAALPPALAGALLILSPPVELRNEPAIRPPAPKRAALPPFWYEAEIPLMEAVLRRDPGNEHARYRLLQLHAARNDTSAAQEQLKLLIEQHPESPLAVKAAEDWIAALCGGFGAASEGREARFGAAHEGREARFSAAHEGRLSGRSKRPPARPSVNARFSREPR